MFYLVVEFPQNTKMLNDDEHLKIIFDNIFLNNFQFITLY